ncbi:arylsulfatase [Cerasicoccus arenae]|uniref:Sulfatase n=1 Tax=Cerasicoccus arenae TaxID=424488 RepID=A0A8J3DGK8_9BACT|nr:arylsulfatase [Cerasicoccus arenae]MBK1860063.1 arylsulfatase [Cerasicoccus arenae]GHC04599.1 sulfatase [Cerasicoccus arenae]
MAKTSPNFILILNDDMGYSDLGCYGGEVQTPNLDSLANSGLRYTQFYNTARCCPSRASLLTGLHPHQADVGHMMGDDDVDGYLGDLNPQSVTIAEALKPAGYRNYISGKWHVTRHIKKDSPRHNWPLQRGFDDYFGIVGGAANFYQPSTLVRGNERVDPFDEPDDFFFTDAISKHAIKQINEHAANHSEKPFFQYVAYTAPHWPLHAREEDIAKYRGRFDAGWDHLRDERLHRMVEMGIIDERWGLTDRDPEVRSWEDQPHKDWEARRMEVYAAQIDRMDQGIGRIIQTLKDNNQFENTVIVFLADNGGCAEEIQADSSNWLIGRSATELTRDGRPVRFGNMPDIIPGAEDTYSSYGVPWANVSNTPFRLYKHWVHEGGIATPFIVHWPTGIEARGELRTQCAQLPDVMATFLDIAEVDYPTERMGQSVKPLEGYTMTPTFKNDCHGREILCWEHEGNKALRRGKWKLVCRHPGDWELFDMVVDRTEMHNLAVEKPDLVAELSALYQEWANRVGVMEWDDLVALRKARE